MSVKFSFEVFPPVQSGPTGQQRFERRISVLDDLNPLFLSVTYGAGGSGRDRSVACVSDLIEQCASPIAAHLTCVGETRDETLLVAQRFWDLGIRHIVALGGDLPKGGRRNPAGFRFASDMIAALLRVYPFDISVACFPEGRGDGRPAIADLDILAAKADAGATRAIGQFCFDDEAFLRFRDAVVARKIPIQIVPGIMPLSNIEGLATFAAKCGAYLPDWLHAEFQDLPNEGPARIEKAEQLLIAQLERLKAVGVQQFHIYTMNQTVLPMAAARFLSSSTPRSVESLVPSSL